METIIIYNVYAEDKLKLSTIDEFEANNYMKMYYNYHNVLCEKEVMESNPVNHSKYSSK